MPLAFSYVRFSSAKQSEGNSEARQDDAAAKYAAQHNLELDSHSYRDLGVSAFKGKNAEAALGAFLRAVESGIIPRGSYLLVENVDRLSRQAVTTALDLFLRITRSGITIVTLFDQQEYSAESIDANWTQLIITIASFARGHEESKLKADRVRKGKEKNLRAGTVTNERRPSWIKPNETMTDYIADVPKTLIIRRIFEMSLAGNGLYLITKQLNAEGVPPISEFIYKDKKAVEWNIPMVLRLLRSQAVIGRLYSKVHNEFFENRYPAIVDREVFFQVQEKLTERNRTGKGRKGENVSNLFSGLFFCGCGAKMRMQMRKAPKGRPEDQVHGYLLCSTTLANSKCQAKMINYQPVEDALLTVLLKKRAIGNPEANVEAVDPRVEIRAAIADKEYSIDKLLDLIEDSPMAQSKKYMERLAEREKELEELRTALLNAAPPKPTQAIWDEAMAAYENHQLLKSTGGAELREARLKLQEVMRQFVERIDMPNEVHEYKTNDKKYREAFVTMRGDWGAILAERNIRRKNDGGLGRFETVEGLKEAATKPTRVVYELPKIGKNARK